MQEHRIYWHRSAFSLSAQLHLIFSIYVQHSTYMLKRGLQVHVVILLLKTYKLTEVAGEGGLDLAPQNFLLSQQFRHLMRCKKYVNKICLPCLVPEIQLFVNIFGRNSKWPPEVQKGSPVQFFVVSYQEKLFTYFLHLMRCLNIWDNKEF